MWRWTLMLLVAVALGVNAGCPRQDPVVPPPDEPRPVDQPVDPAPLDEPSGPVIE